MKQNKKTHSLVIMGLLSALIIIMSLTPLGYLKIGIICITFNVIPVAIGAVTLGPTAGLVLGTVFGLTSFSRCFGIDPFGSFLLQINPFYTFVMCVISRALIGLFTGLIYKALSRTNTMNEHYSIAFSLSGFCASIINTVLFVGSMLLMFGKQNISNATGRALDASSNIILFFASFVSFNAILEAITALIITGAICSSLKKAHLISVHSLNNMEGI